MAIFKMHETQLSSSNKPKISPIPGTTKCTDSVEKTNIAFALVTLVAYEQLMNG